MSDAITPPSKRPPVAIVECVIFSKRDDRPYVALTENMAAHGLGAWMLPSDLGQDGDDPLDAASRKLRKELSPLDDVLCPIPLQQFEGRTFERGPGQKATSWAFIACLTSGLEELPPLADTERTRWFPLDDLPELAFDHGQVIAKAFKRVQTPWHCYPYARPMVAADCVVFSIKDGKLQVALVLRGHDTEGNKWALPGGFLREQESPKRAAQRELFEETGIADRSLADQPMLEVGTYGDPGRDPRGWVISTAFQTLIPMNRVHLVAGTDAKKAEWFPVDRLPDLAFDHATILEDARKQLRAILETDLPASAESVFQFLPDEFTFGQAQHMFQIVTGREVNASNFQKWLKGIWEFEETGQKTRWKGGKPAKLLRLAGRKNSST